MAPMTRAMATKGTKRPREQSAERTASATFIADPDANNSDNDASKGGNDQSISPPELIAPDGDLILVLGNGHKLRVHSLFLTRHVAFLKKLVSGTSGASSPLGDDGVPEIGIPNIHPVAVSLFCRAIHSKPAVRPPTAEDMHHLGRFVRKHECHEPMLYAADCWFSRIGFSTVLGGKVLSQLLVAAFWLKRPVWLRRYGLPFIDSDIDFDENALEGFKANIDSKLLRATIQAKRKIRLGQAGASRVLCVFCIDRHRDSRTKLHETEKLQQLHPDCRAHPEKVARACCHTEAPRDFPDNRRVTRLMSKKFE